MANFHLKLVNICYFSAKKFEKSPIFHENLSKMANFRPSVGCYTRPPLEIQKRPRPILPTAKLVGGRFWISQGGLITYLKGLWISVEK